MRSGFTTFYANNTAPLFAIVLMMALLTASLAGCAGVQRKPGAPQDDDVAPRQNTAFNGEYQTSERLAEHPPRSIAVLPFGGDPADWDFSPESMAPTDVVRTVLYNHLASLPFRDLELADVDARLTRAGLLTPAEVELELSANPRRLRDILGVEAVVSGHVTHFDRVYVGVVSQVAVGCDVRLTDLTTGEILWSARHVSRELGGGVALTPIGLAMNALASAWNLRSVELLRQTDEVFRDIVATLADSLPPSPVPATVAQPPRIDFFAARPARVLRVGEATTLTVVGDPGARATAVLTRADGSTYRELELAPLPSELRMRAIESALTAMGTNATSKDAAGIRAYLSARDFYETTLPVTPGDEEYGLSALAKLERADGASAQAPLVSGPLDLDGTPPPVPVNVRTTPGNARVQVAWSGANHGYGTQYVVQTGTGPNGPFDTKMLTTATELTLERLTNFTPVYLRLAARDQAGNTSAFTAAVRAVPEPEPGVAALPSPGRVLQGTIAQPVLLRAADGPFEVRGDVLVAAGGAVHVAPGTMLRFGPQARLVVRGGTLAVHGEPGSPVRFSPALDNAPPGSFGGIVIDAPERVVIRHAIIKNASTGLDVMNAAPLLHGVHVTGSGQAGMVLGKGASPIVTCSRFTRNQGMGAIVAQGDDLSPSLRDNFFSANVPFDVQNFSPVELDMTGNVWGMMAPNGSGRFLGAVNGASPLPEFPLSCQEAGP